MGADFTAKISFNPDCKPSEPAYKIKCPALEIAEEGSGDIREMMDDVQDKITDKIATEFRTTPRSIELIGYSMTLKFKVTGPVNRSLAEFETYKATIVLPDGYELDVDKLSKTAKKVLEYCKRTGKTPEQVIAMAKEELARQKAATEGAIS